MRDEVQRTELPASAFAKANGIVGMHRSGDTLHVEAEHELSAEAIRALQFAEGSDVEIKVSLKAARVTAPPLRSVSTPALQSPKLADVIEASPTKSLTERLPEFLSNTGTLDDTIECIVRLTSAGRSVGSLGLAAGRSEIPLHHPSQGETFTGGAGIGLAEWGESLATMPAWIRISLASCHDEAGQVQSLAGIAAIRERRRSWRRSVSASATASLFLWPALVALSAAVSWPLAVAISAVGVAFAVRFFQLRGATADADAVRAEILRIVATLSGLGIAPANAVRIAALRLKEIEPTWGEAPGTREGLAAMLKLGPVDRLVLMTGDLHQTAQRVAEECERRAGAGLEVTSIAAKASFGVLLLATVAGLLA
ncbi:hypothetical protein [Tsuneonella sp. HG222]